MRSASRAATRLRRMPSRSISLGRFTNSGGVGNDDRRTGEIQAHFDDVARRTCFRRNDRRIAPRQRVEQARLAGIRRAQQSNPEAFPHDLTAMLIVEMNCDFRPRAPRPVCVLRRARQPRHVPLVGEIDCRFGQGSDLNQPRPPTVVELRKHAADLCQCLAALGFCFGFNEIRKALDLGEVELTVLEGAANEFTWLGEAASRDLAQRTEDSRDRRTTAVDLELDDILAGLAG